METTLHTGVNKINNTNNTLVSKVSYLFIQVHLFCRILIFKEYQFFLLEHFLVYFILLYFGIIVL